MRPYASSPGDSRTHEILTEMTYGHFDYPLSVPSRAEGWLL